MHCVFLDVCVCPVENDAGSVVPNEQGLGQTHWAYFCIHLFCSRLDEILLQADVRLYVAVKGKYLVSLPLWEIVIHDTAWSEKSYERIREQWGGSVVWISLVTLSPSKAQSQRTLFLSILSQHSSCSFPHEVPFLAVAYLSPPLCLGSSELHTGLPTSLCCFAGFLYQLFLLITNILVPSWLLSDLSVLRPEY